MPKLWLFVSPAGCSGDWCLDSGLCHQHRNGRHQHQFQGWGNDTQVNQDVYTDLAAQFEPVAGIKAQLQSPAPMPSERSPCSSRVNGDTITSSTLKGKVDLGSYETDSTFFAELTYTFEFAGVWKGSLPR